MHFDDCVRRSWPYPRARYTTQPLLTLYVAHTSACIAASWSCRKEQESWEKLTKLYEQNYRHWLWVFSFSIIHKLTASLFLPYLAVGKSKFSNSGLPGISAFNKRCVLLHLKYKSKYKKVGVMHLCGMQSLIFQAKALRQSLGEKASLPLEIPHIAAGKPPFSISSINIYQ